MFMEPNSAPSWNRTPNLRRTLYSSREPSFTMSRPSIQISPRSGFSRPMMFLRNTDLPVPEGPSMRVILPLGMSQVMSSRTVCGPNDSGRGSRSRSRGPPASPRHSRGPSTVPRRNAEVPRCPWMSRAIPLVLTLDIGSWPDARWARRLFPRRGTDETSLRKSGRAKPQIIYEGRADVKMPLATHHLLGAEDDGPEPGSRWSAPRTNDLHAGEDRR